MVVTRVVAGVYTFKDGGVWAHSSGGVGHMLAVVCVHGSSVWAHVSGAVGHVVVVVFGQMLVVVLGTL